MLRSESGSAAVYGVIIILLVFLLLWFFTGLSPLDVIGDFGNGLGGMSASERQKIDNGNSSSPSGVSSFGKAVSGAYGGGQ